MAGGRTFVIRLLGDSRNVEAAFGKTAGAVSKFAAKSLVAIGVLNKVYDGLKASAEATLAYDKTLMNLTTQIGMTQEAAQEIGRTLLNMTDLATGPQELADAFYFIASSGLEGAAALETLEAAAKASAIGMGETEVIADALTSILNAYGTENINAAHATDTLLKAVRDGKAEADQMAASIGAVIPIAASMGVRFEDVATSMAIMTRNGVGAAESVTQLRSFLVGLLQPSAEATEAMAKYGLNASELQATLRGPEGLWGALTMIQEATGGNSQAFAEITGRVEALNFLNTMLGSSLEANTQLFNEQADAVGITDQAFVEYTTSAAGRIEALNAQLEASKVLFGTGAGAVKGYGAAATVLETVLFRVNQAMRDNAADEEVATRLRMNAAEALDRNRQMLEGLTGAEREAMMSSDAYRANLEVLLRTRQLVGLTEEQSVQNLHDLRDIMSQGADVTNELTMSLDGLMNAQTFADSSTAGWAAGLVEYYGMVEGAGGTLLRVEEALTEEMWEQVSAVQTAKDEYLRLIDPQYNLFRSAEDAAKAQENLNAALATADTADDAQAIIDFSRSYAELDAAVKTSELTIDAFLSGPMQAMVDAGVLTEGQMDKVSESIRDIIKDHQKLDGTKTTSTHTVRVKYIEEGSVEAGRVNPPGRAAGGPVQANRLYLVGEEGPELFASSAPGTIIPNNQTMAFLNEQPQSRQVTFDAPADGGGVTIEAGAVSIEVNVNGRVSGDVGAAVASSMDDAIARLARELAVT